MLARTCLGYRSFDHWTLQRNCRKVTARLGFYVAIIHFHVDNFHKFNLRSKLLNFLLENGERQHEVVDKLKVSKIEIKLFHIQFTFNSSFSWYKSGESSGTRPMPFNENDAVMPRTRARLSHWSPWPRSTRKTFGPKTSIMVVVVDNCVRTNPKKYLTSGPARGNMNKLVEMAIEMIHLFM